MCGIVGYSGKQNYNLEKIRTLMIWNNYERGEDATGLFTPNTGTIKDIKKAYSYLYSKEVKEGLKEDTTFIGHVRAKTVGVNKAENAHPFTYGSITLVHNGTLQWYNQWAIDLGLKGTDWDVDSQVLAQAVAKNFEVIDQLKKERKQPEFLSVKALSEYRGAAATLFYNANDKNLYAYHDKERPLFYGYDENRNMYISSIKESLEAIECTDVTEFEVRYLHLIRKGEIKFKEHYEAPPEVVTTTTTTTTARPVTKLVKDMFTASTFAKGISGIVSGVVKNRHLVGFWVLSDTDVKVPYNDNAKITKGKWYFIEGYWSENEFNVWIKDDNGHYKRAFTHQFKTSDFIPVPGKYVVAVDDIMAKRDNALAWSKGDLIKVEDFHYGAHQFVSAISNTLKRAFNLPLENVRVATNEDVNKWFQKIIDEAPDEEATEEAEIIEPVVDAENPTSNEPEIIPEEEDKEDSYCDIMDTYVDFGIYATVIAMMAEAIKTMEQKYHKGLDITRNLEQLRETTDEVMTVKFVEDLVKINM